jgi:hydroxyethylthiazole kinase-like uncharacterized protein yjeF
MRAPLLMTDDIRAIEARGLAATSPGELMSRAATALAQVCARHLRRMPAGTPVLALVGPGNNGGDALCAAAWLHTRGWSVQAIALKAGPPAADDAQRAWARWNALGHIWLTLNQLEPWLQTRQPCMTLVIDGLFGIGLQRPLEGPARTLVDTLHRFATHVIAADVPSGIDAETGAIVGPPGSVAVHAAATVTFIADKPGLHTGAGRVHAGAVTVESLGLQVDLPTAGRLIDRTAAQQWIRPRAPDAHKGSHGDVLVLRGAPAMQGACVLALLGAQAAGAGRLYLGIDDRNTLQAGCATPSMADPHHPEFMRRGLIVTDVTSPEAALQAWGPADALVVGCGLGVDPWAQQVVATALLHPGGLVLDADALNCIAQSAPRTSPLKSRSIQGRITVITPHPLEAARLLNTSTAAVQRNRIEAARQLAQETGAVTVLKGAGTVIAWPSRASGSVTADSTAWAINASGGPLLAVAGTGDVLAGIVGALLAQGLAAADAACLGTWLHGAAADALAAQPQWSAGIGLPASRLPEAVRETINQLAADRS